MQRASAGMVGAAIAAIASAPTWAWAQQAPEPNKYPYGPYVMGPYMMDWGGGGYGMIFGPLFMILVLVLVIAAAVIIARGLGGAWYSAPPPHQLPPGRTPLDILKERYARGEINKEEFEERRRVLGD
jgi:putative membrane protein